MDRLAVKRQFLKELRDYSKGALADELKGLKGAPAVAGEEAVTVDSDSGLDADLAGDLSPEAEAELEGEDVSTELGEAPGDELREGELDLDKLDPKLLARLLGE